LKEPSTKLVSTLRHGRIKSSSTLWPANIPCRCERRKRVARIAMRTSGTAGGPSLQLDPHTGFWSQLSEAETDTVTGIISLFGGNSTFGDAEAEQVVGGCLSSTVTFALQVDSAR